MPVETATAATPAESPRIPGITDPFPGLRPFESDEEPIFRGRQRHTGELLRRLAKHRFLAVVGTSGSGKSSLVRAGLLPALDRGFLAGASSRWRKYRGGASDPLPVLQHALVRTYLEWKSRPREKGEPIDLPDYRRAGRMVSALDHHAEAVFLNQLDDADRLWTERILRCLTTTELGRPIRRPTPLADLYKIVFAQDEKHRTEVDSVLGVLRKPENSFVRLNKDSSVDISHESLIWK